MGRHRYVGIYGKVLHYIGKGEDRKLREVGSQGDSSFLSLQQGREDVTSME